MICAFVTRLTAIYVTDLFPNVITMFNFGILFNPYLFFNVKLRFLTFLSCCFDLIKTLDTDARAFGRRH